MRSSRVGGAFVLLALCEVPRRSNAAGLRSGSRRNPFEDEPTEY
ncbi:hypothetical protein [Actinospica robiniae]|nr:hypothetical protein [Actinospica robiniae]